MQAVRSAVRVTPTYTLDALLPATPSRSGRTGVSPDRRMKCTASVSGMRRWPPAVRSTPSRPSSAHRFSDDSLTPMAVAKARGDRYFVTI
jgi:hypothetical protein